MIYNQIILSPAGIMEYAEYNQGVLTRYCNDYGNTITPTYDYVFNASNTIVPTKDPVLPAAGEKRWMDGQMTYQQVSFISNAVLGYQTNDGQGNYGILDANGNGLSLGVNGLVEMHLIAANVPAPSWAS